MEINTWMQVVAIAICVLAPAFLGCIALICVLFGEARLERKEIIRKTVDKTAKRIKEAIEKYRLAEEWEENGAWYLDATLLASEVTLGEGIIDKVANEIKEEEKVK